jgi:hypothetical protein
VWFKCLRPTPSKLQTSRCSKGPSRDSIGGRGRHLVQLPRSRQWRCIDVRHLFDGLPAPSHSGRTGVCTSSSTTPLEYGPGTSYSFVANSGFCAHGSVATTLQRQ